MGFWQTGYFEFHEPVGLDYVPHTYEPVQHPCTECGQLFESIEDLRQHRFAHHPLQRPKLWLNNREIGSAPIKITSRLAPINIRTEGCKKATINGKNIKIDDISLIISQFSASDCDIILTNDSQIEVKFRLEFRIASEDDLAGVEDAFKVMIQNRTLNITEIDRFITKSQQYDTATNYYNGICEYLYGVLIKEQHPSSNLPFDKYEDKYNNSASELYNYDRPLARVIRGVIGFHFNHFDEVKIFCSAYRIGRAAEQYTSKNYLDTFSASYRNLDEYITDYATERIVRYSILPANKFVEHIDDAESFLKSNIVEYDKIKIHIILAKIYAKYNYNIELNRHLKVLRRVPHMEKFYKSICLVNESAHGK